MKSIFEWEVHPAAAVFPMLPDDELDELAEDIKANGLVHPLVVKDGVLIDGRNRREACKRAGVEPATVELDGQDAVAYIASSNINRRHMTKGQRAMALAMLYPEPQEHGRGRKCLIFKHFNRAAISWSRTVIRHLPDAAALVLSGGLALDKAYQRACEVRDSMLSDSQKLERLQKAAPHIAEKVKEGELDVTAALIAHEEEQKKQKMDRLGLWAVYRNLEMTLPLLKNPRDQVNMWVAWKQESGVDLRVLAREYVQAFEAFIKELENAEERITEI